LIAPAQYTYKLVLSICWSCNPTWFKPFSCPGWNVAGCDPKFYPVLFLNSKR